VIFETKEAESPNLAGNTTHTQNTAAHDDFRLTSFVAGRNDHNIPLIMENEEKVVEKNAQQPEDSSSTMSATVTATAGETKTTKNEKMFRLFLLFMMTAQNSTVVLVSRYTRAGVSNEDSYVINDLIMVQEFGKLILAAALEYNATNGQLVRSMKENIFDRPKDFFRILIPSLLYLVQNSLLYVAISNLTAPMFQVTYQCKLLTTAVVSVIMLQRKYSLKQWLCLTALGIGVAIVVLGAQSDSKKDASDSNEEGEDANVQNLFVGLMAVTIACLCSAFAGVYFEFVLKRPTNDGGEARAPVSMWMRNVQMAFFSICIAYINMVRDSDRGVTGLVDENNDPIIKPFMHGFTGWVYVVVMLQAGGGLLVAAVIKYADNVLKGMATGVSVVTATL